MSGHGHVDKTLESVKEWFLALTFIDCALGVALFVVPVGIGNLFLYETAALPAQMLGAVYLSLGILMFMIRDFNQSAYRLVLDYKIMLSGLTTLAMVFSLAFSDVKWPLLIMLLAVVGMCGVCVYLRKTIPRPEADDHGHDHGGGHH